MIKSRVPADSPNDVIAPAPIGLVRIGADLRVIQANLGYASMVLAAADEIAGSSISRYFHPDEMARVSHQLSLLSTGSIDAVVSDSRALRSDMSTIRLHWTATAVRKASGEMDYFIAMFEDTTAKHQADVAAARNLNVLERLNRLKTEFLTMVSHEFRTALVGIQGFSELMRDAESLNLVEVRSFANEVYNDARRLDQMLDKMLDLDRSAGSQTVLHIGRISLNSAVHDAVAIAIAEGLKHHVVTNLDPALPMVSGDGTKLRQLVSILLSNAMKFSSEESEVVVSSRADSGHVHVTVKDHGTGMPNDFDSQLFGRYRWSADNPTTKVIGTGLGLPMAREIVELHGGKIWFDNVAGGGSEFHFTIPMAAKPAPVA
ncbi:MAG TPA: HAMP domain-containing sensor histidine kinase [Candidatus Eisenbacteria bacterium]|nr:HAMP domain-containing sensor histidine kinase [Candidatus Eisenbacteria bacterium]